jgi:trans-AT polyketide synthase/acyltransferase/oxidoreductase domain-containing protein
VAILRDSRPSAWLFPGQGSQARGMGGSALFGRFPELVAEADAILGYSIAELCLDDPHKQIGQTQYSQPALFVVNALSFFDRIETQAPPDFYAGHSLGEYDALLAAGCFGFATGVRLVRERGRLMSAASGGGMAAVIGLSPDRVRAELEARGLSEALDLANINSVRQVVVSGELAAIRAFAAAAAQEKFARIVPLAVSAAFHSRFMAPAAEAFAAILDDIVFADPKTPVLSNVTGQPYRPGEVRTLLARQITAAVRWRDQMLFLRRAGVEAIEQVGPGRVLTDLWAEAAAEPLQAMPAAEPSAVPPETKPSPSRPAVDAQATPSAPGASGSRPTPEPPPSLSPAPPRAARPGDAFCRRHGVAHAYVAGSMYRGIASVDLVVRMARAGFLAFFGAGGLPLTEVGDAVRSIRDAVPAGAPFGMNLLSAPDRPDQQRALVDLYLASGVTRVEASGFMQVSEDIVAFRFKGAGIEAGRARAPNMVFAKLSRLEVATEFLRPPAEKLLDSLRRAGRLTEDEIAAARRLPVAADIAVEADSGGHTDAGVMLALLPSVVRLRDRLEREEPLDEAVCIGAAGGVGTPEAIAACFLLGAGFVVCGSIHQCTPEAGTSAAVKDLLSTTGVHDTGYAPAGDLFITGAKVQVVKRGTLFAPRANYLYDVYRNHDRLESMSGSVRATVERYLGLSWPEEWERCVARLEAERPHELRRIAGNGKAIMARVFKGYFTRTIRTALAGDLADKVNWQVHCGPAMGAFNRFAEGNCMADWRERRVDRVATVLMEQAAALRAR